MQHGPRITYKSDVRQILTQKGGLGWGSETAFLTSPKQMWTLLVCRPHLELLVSRVLTVAYKIWYTGPSEQEKPTTLLLKWKGVEKNSELCPPNL